LWRENYHRTILDFCNNIGTLLPNACTPLHPQRAIDPRGLVFITRPNSAEAPNVCSWRWETWASSGELGVFTPKRIFRERGVEERKRLPTLTRAAERDGARAAIAKLHDNVTTTTITSIARQPDRAGCCHRSARPVRAAQSEFRQRRNQLCEHTAPLQPRRPDPWRTRCP
jgi:hypothetical protein